MDFSHNTLRNPPKCQRASLKVVLNLGKTVKDLVRRINQIYDLGGCSLNPTDSKVSLKLGRWFQERAIS